MILIKYFIQEFLNINLFFDFVYSKNLPIINQANVFLKNSIFIYLKFKFKIKLLTFGHLVNITLVRNVKSYSSN